MPLEDYLDDVLDDDMYEDEDLEREAENDLDELEEYYDDGPDYYDYPEFWGM